MQIRPATTDSSLSLLKKPEKHTITPPPPGKPAPFPKPELLRFVPAAHRAALLEEWREIQTIRTPELLADALGPFLAKIDRAVGRQKAVHRGERKAQRRRRRQAQRKSR